MNMNMDMDDLSIACEGAQILTPQDNAHYFFGYYDMRATQKPGVHLCHRVPFMDRLPTAEDVCEVGYVQNNAFFKIGETTAWNFQQGAMLQYHPTLADTVYYNVCKDGAFYTLTHNFATGEKKYADRATACVSPDGKWGLAVDFGRIFDFRPGYGYAGCADRYAAVNAPREDGVFLVDMETGHSRLLISLATLAPLAGFLPEDKVMVNHITFNTTSDRYVMLVRSFPHAGQKMWLTSMVVGDLSGAVHAVLKKTYVSHYCWADDKEIVAHCTVEESGKQGVYRIHTESGEWVEYEMPRFHTHRGMPDIHCNLSPDGQYMIGDGYEREGKRSLLAYSLRTGDSKLLLAVNTVKPPVVDIRCDLHARFVFGGTHISYDTTENGRREIAIIPASALDF